MTDKQPFFESPDQARHEAEIADRYGPEALEAAKAVLGAKTPEELALWQTEMQAIHQAVAALMATGAAPGSAAAQAVAARHFRWISAAWTPDRTSYAALGRLYVENDEFRRMYDQIRPGMAVWLSSAMVIYAERAL